MTTTPDTERRERYAAAMLDVGRALLFAPDEYALADAAMTVADQELTRVREELDEANRRHENFKMGATFGGTEMRKRLTEAEDALRTQAAEVRAAALTEAADFVGNDDDCGCGGCDSCVPNKLAAELRRMAAAARPDNTEAHPPHVGYVLERAISDGWVEERVVDEPAAAVQAVEGYDAWWLLPATLRVVRRATVSAVVSVHEVAKPGPCTCGHTFEQHLLICGRSRQCSLCDCDAYRPDNTTGA